jgi:chaperonin GroES
MSNMNVSPLGDRVLVKQDDEPQKTEGGIFLPESAKEAPQWGTVMTVGPGKLLENGEVRALTVKKGDKVIFGKYAGTKIKLNNEELMFLREEDIMAIAN